MKNDIDPILKGNEKWHQKMIAKDPSFFEELAKEQTPKYLWIGCSDSRVSAEQITGSKPGTIFVHRNIANTIIHTDANVLSVVFYAVTILKVKHIIVCGHYDCGGIGAAMGNEQYGFIDNWLTHLKDVYHIYQDELNAIDKPDERSRRFAELNVIEQSRNIAKISFIQDCWSTGSFPYIHGLIFDIANGLLKELDLKITSAKELSPIFRREIE